MRCHTQRKAVERKSMGETQRNAVDTPQPKREKKAMCVELESIFDFIQRTNRLGWL